ncbi:LOW QUALITY PROTEIN: hypothetical protein T265_14449 [Opisthorchis viverrini]|uniref:Uncharacterized protein n=1 Tax=Opisthorchis viverrini TaxID=6198 RepID=A0A074ZAI4_OPIVI|nr:LOW QUALITY PROTEIN: hypothetical protein T265_14449 [Opisthorchis viverrini]KER24296.1 LOW QUALITY PROTEIN: hypothetical protein T265_14449 [Opisthorchis viverrini]
MASSRLVQRKKKRALNCISLFDQVVCKSLKLFQQDFGADETALKLLDVLWKSEDKWHTAVGKLVREVRRLHSEISSLRALQVSIYFMLYPSHKARTQELLETESNRRRHAEHCRDRLRRKIDAIREVLEGNDVDQARRYLENIDKSTMIGDKSVQSTKLEHSAGSLLDTANVSDDSEMDACRKETCGRTSKSRRASSAGHAMDMVRGPLRRSARLSKLRASSAPKIVAPDLSTEHSQHGYSKSPPAGHKRRSDDSDNSYYGVEMKRSLLTIPHTAHHLPSTVTGEDSDSSNFHFISIGRQQNTNNATTPTCPIPSNDHWISSLLVLNDAMISIPTDVEYLDAHKPMKRQLVKSLRIDRDLLWTVEAQWMKKPFATENIRAIYPLIRPTGHSHYH